MNEVNLLDKSSDIDLVDNHFIKKITILNNELNRQNHQLNCILKQMDELNNHLYNKDKMIQNLLTATYIYFSATMIMLMFL